MNLGKNKRTIIVEDIENGGVRITVAGTPYLTGTSSDRTHNMSTRDINQAFLSDFAPDQGEDRAAYSARHCTDTGNLHGPSGCDGMCHDFNCSRPADFFEHWKSGDAQERCIPFCKWHSEHMYYRFGRAVLWALAYGVVEELPFWTEQDPLPGGLPRCDSHYRAVDSDGDSGWARCTSPATKRARVTENSGKGLEIYEAKVCTHCAARRLTDSTKIEILGDLEVPPHCTEMPNRTDGMPGEV
jgi:hypothetical protein